ncbi:MAG: hypothetical protein QXK78_01605 [Candidatus Bathyarchaeia archaeon]
MAGRKPGSKNYELSPHVLDALVSLWPSHEEPLSFTQIHHGLVKKGIIKNIKNKMATSRILKRACEKGIIKKEEEKYYLNIAPENFRLFDFLTRLREQGEIYTSIVNGLMVHFLICETLPKAFSLGEDRKLPDPIPDQLISPIDYVGTNGFTAINALAILLFRLASIFNAIRAYIMGIQTFRWWEDKALPDYVLKQVLLEFLPFMIGEVHGQDVEKLKKVVEQLVEAIPDTIKDERGEEYRVLYKLGKFSVKGCFNALREFRETNVFVHPDDLKDFALIITPPESEVAFDDIEQRYIKWSLELEKENTHPYWIAKRLLDFSRKNVELVLNAYGLKLFGPEKLAQIKEAYEKMYAIKQLPDVVETKKITRDQLLKFRELGDKYGYKTVITLMVFTHDIGAFQIPVYTSALARVYPFLSEEQIRQWLDEGVKLKKEILGVK